MFYRNVFNIPDSRSLGREDLKKKKKPAAKAKILLENLGSQRRYETSASRHQSVLSLGINSKKISSAQSETTITVFSVYSKLITNHFKYRVESGQHQSCGTLLLLYIDIKMPPREASFNRQ